MGCCGDREKEGPVKNEQKWDYINLNDFKSTSCGTPLSYGILYFFLIISLAVYIVDLWTASNLLFFDRWSGQVKPVIPFNISRWIFAGCIILTWVLLVYRWLRALRAMRTGVVAASYLDPLAVRVQSIRVGENGRGWRRFLVFAALTKGRKGAEYVALFTYFTFEAWLRIVFAEGPRQVINALTLYSVLQAKLIPTGKHKANDGHTPGVQFFVNVKILADEDKQQAAILFGMLYTLIIWVFSALSLLLAILFYILFLWHHIPSQDGGLSKYCRRKIDRRLHKIVMATVNTALAKEDKKRAQQDLAKPGFAGVAMNDVKRQPTLPILDDNASVAEPTIPTLSRPTNQFDLSSYPSRPASPFAPRPQSPFENRPESRSTHRAPGSALSREPTLPSFDNEERPGGPSRQTTHSSMNSNTSFASDAPLMSQAGDMGHGGRADSRSRGPSRMDSERSQSTTRTFHSARPPAPGRSYTGSSRGTQPPFNPRMGPPPRSNTGTSSTSMAPSYRSYSQPGVRGPMSRDASVTSSASSRRPLDSSGLSRQTTQEYEMQPPRGGSAMSHALPPRADSAMGGPRSAGPIPGRAAPPPSGPLPFPPRPSGRDSPSYRAGGPPSAPTRNFNHPSLNRQPPGTDYFGESAVPPRAGTAPIGTAQSVGHQDHASIIDMYGHAEQDMPHRPSTTGPATGWGRQQMPPRGW